MWKVNNTRVGGEWGEATSSGARYSIGGVERNFGQQKVRQSGGRRQKKIQISPH